MAAARRRGLVYPYELVRMLESGDIVAAGRFEEHDLDPRGRLRNVRGRSLGRTKAGVVFGVIRTPLRPHEAPVTRVLPLSDPTRDFGALAESECRRILAAFDLAESLGAPVEWVSVSAGARIDWETGTENLDWTARVLGRIVRFTQAGGEVNVVVPGTCVGAQSYWNAEATMLTHTRGLLILTDRGSMVLTGKRASGFDGSPDSLRHGQLEHGAEIGRAVVNFEGPIVFVVTSRYHGGAYVVFSKTLNPGLRVAALAGSFASVIGGAPAAAVVFARDVARRAAELGGGPEAKARATAELAARFDGVHTVERARDVGSIDDLLEPERLRPYVVGVLDESLTSRA